MNCNSSSAIHSLIFKTVTHLPASSSHIRLSSLSIPKELDGKFNSLTVTSVTAAFVQTVPPFKKVFSILPISIICVHQIYTVPFLPENLITAIALHSAGFGLLYLYDHRTVSARTELQLEMAL